MLPITVYYIDNTLAQEDKPVITSPIVIFHIIMGTLALVGGYIAVSVRKGALLHRRAGTVFFITMIGMSVSATWLALVKERPDSIISGILAFYLVTTSWMTVRREENETGFFEVIGMLVVLGTGGYAFATAQAAAQTIEGTIRGFPAGFYYFQGGLALLCATLDLNMILRKGLSGVPRISRHLWRMMLALVIAIGSLVGQERIIPDTLRSPYILIPPVLITLAIMAFWIVRIRFTSWYNAKKESQI
ncbi:MAG: hypothetical protein Pars2KO_23600 [Parasphingorhabdus sp.]